MNREDAAPSYWQDTPESPVMVTLAGGAYSMGESPADKFANDTERPARWIDVPAFALSRFPITVAEYRLYRPNHARQDNARWPVVDVTWHDAQGYAAWLSQTTGGAYRLPSEAEWEFACRAGSQTLFASDAELTPQDANYLYDESGARVGPGRRSACGEFPANAFGIYDMRGNVCEWVEDVWRADYHGREPDHGATLTGPNPQHRVIRGGAWDYLPRLLRNSWRDYFDANRRRDNLGFRVAASQYPI